MEKDIKVGHTNKRKYIYGDKFVIEKTNNGFNHRIDYSLLSEFDFVPKLIEDTKDKVVGEYIEGEMLSDPTDEDLVKVAKILRQLHKSDLKFPTNNFKKRSQTYIAAGHKINRRGPEVENFGKSMNTLMSKMKKINTCHNDVGGQNLIKDKNGKIGLVDGEYATMGDKHFDLAFFIKSSRLSDERAQVFLDAYNSIDDYQAYFEQYMPQGHLFTNGLTLTGAYGQEKEPFPLDGIKKQMLKKNKGH